MALGTSKLKTGVVKLAAGTLMATEVQQDGTPLATPDTWHDLGYLEDVEFTDDAAQDEVYDGNGDLIATLDNERKVKLVGTLLQSDEGVLSIRDVAVGKFYRVYHFAKAAGAKWRELFAAICQLKITSPEKYGKEVTKPQATLTFLKNEAAITIHLTTPAELPPGAKTAADVVIAAGAYYKRVFTTVA